MCGALTAKANAEEELQFATSLINQVTEDMRGRGTKIGVHVCRGNWSTQENVLLKGPYNPLIPFFKQMNIDQFILEFATPRAGDLDILNELRDFEIGLGVVNPRTDEMETVEWIVSRVQEARGNNPDRNIFLNPDCGFGTFAQRPMNEPDRAYQKLKVMVEAAKILKNDN